MNQRELASVLFAVIGVYIVIARLPDLMIFIGMLAAANPELEPPGSGIPQRLIAMFGLVGSLVALLAAGCLIRLRHRLANRLFATGTQALNVPEVQTVAFSVLGCYFAVQGISRFGWAGRFDWGAATLLVLGIALFFGASSVSRLWALSRSVGPSGSPAERIRTW
jgi:hypothetical protein